MTEALLPVPFLDLTPFADWALEPERARTEKRVAASMEEISAFYDAMMRRFEEIVDHLEGQFGQDMSASAHRLFLMTLSLVEVVPPVELLSGRKPSKPAIRYGSSRSAETRASGTSLPQAWRKMSTGPSVSSRWRGGRTEHGDREFFRI